LHRAHSIGRQSAGRFRQCVSPTDILPDAHGKPPCKTLRV